MLFSSMIFLWGFLPILLILYFLIPARYLKIRNVLLLAASLLFYAWGEPDYLILLLLIVLINYVTALLISRGQYRGFILTAGIALNLLFLGYYKYFNFLVYLVNKFAGHEILATRMIALPLGISFFTFQALSYTVDVYRKETAVQKNFFRLLLYVSFFPQLIAGPIVRYQDVEKEIGDRRISLSDFSYGVKRFVFGLSKKVLLSNTLAVFADMIFDGEMNTFSSGLLWFGTICYALQIYYDFSGYSDMAIGLGRMFGFHFKENFNYPYQSDSVREFWRRWHISLSTWFREYVYIPLGGNRGTQLKTCRNLFAVFLLTGLWHGASMNFVFWGVYYGIFMLAERLFAGKWLEKNPIKPLNHLYAMVVVLVGWVFFRLPSLKDGLIFVKNMFVYKSGIFNLGNAISGKAILALAVGIFLAGVLQWIDKNWRDRMMDEKEVRTAEIILEIILLFFCIMRLVSDTYNPFIYFRF